MSASTPSNSTCAISTRNCKSTPNPKRSPKPSRTGSSNQGKKAKGKGKGEKRRVSLSSSSLPFCFYLLPFSAPVLPFSLSQESPFSVLKSRLKIPNIAPEAQPEGSQT